MSLSPAAAADDALIDTSFLLERIEKSDEITPTYLAANSIIN